MTLNVFDKLNNSGKNTVPVIIVLALLIACNYNTNSPEQEKSTYPDVKIVSAMKQVMWSGELQGKINLDTIQNKKGLQGIGPESYLTGELMVIDGKSYISKVTSDSTMKVQETFNSSAPFFVYTHVNEWKKIEIPSTVKDIKALEKFVDDESKTLKRPFAFKVSGKVSNAIIHIQNLPKGTKVSSPKEAHQGQVNYKLKGEMVDIIGFFSTEHKTVFTHHDTFMHLHLLTKDKSKMGHLDEAIFENITLFLPKN